MPFTPPLAWPVAWPLSGFCEPRLRALIVSSIVIVEESSLTRIGYEVVWSYSICALFTRRFHFVRKEWFDVLHFMQEPALAPSAAGTRPKMIRAGMTILCTRLRYTHASRYHYRAIASPQSSHPAYHPHVACSPAQTSKPSTKPSASPPAPSQPCHTRPADP